MGPESNSAVENEGTVRKRTRIPRSHPAHTLEEAASIAAVIHEKNSGLPFDRVLLAKALGTTPASSGFTIRLNSSAKYGLTEGGYNDERIALTPLGVTVVAPTDPAERRRALLEASVQPEMFLRFYEMLDGKRLPEETYAENVLQRELGVHESLTSECFRIIRANGLHVGILGEVGGSLYVSLSGAHVPEDGKEPAPEHPAETSLRPDGGREARETEPHRPAAAKIFIGHAGNADIVDFVKSVLDPFGIPYAVVESDYDAQRPVTAEVSTQMRECNAAILIFATTTETAWKGRREEKRTEKLLYQLGAASVLYGDRIVSLAEQPSDADGADPGFHSVEFRLDRLQETGLAILAELHARDVIKVLV